MANIRIDLDSPVIDGQSLVFKSPVNCSDITGLIIYFPGGSSTIFDFADAHGNNVGSLNLFSANALVKVLLDTELNRAYVQNADTNAYLEGELSKRLLAIESGKYPGCYYRDVTGKDGSEEREWINPPNSTGVSFRTIERLFNKPVYTKMVSRVFTASLNGKGEYEEIIQTQTESIDVGITKMWVEHCMYSKDSEGVLFNCSDSNSTITCFPSVSNGNGEVSISCNTHGNIAKITAYVTIKYIKS